MKSIPVLLSALVLALPVAAADSPDALLSHAGVRAALNYLRQDDARTFREQLAISVIPAPPFKEAVRARDFAERLRAAGLADVTIDAEGNVIGRRPGSGMGPRLVVSAHLDTVFPEGSDLTVTERDGRFHGRGLGDDTRGLAALLTLVRSLEATKIRTRGDLWIVGTVGEEGLGDLRGVKALFREHGASIDGFISVDGLDSPAGESDIVNQGAGSRRWEITFRGPGGHSFNHFGKRPSATHALGRAIAAIADLVPPTDPRTTFTVGTINGGTSVNAIAAEATMLVDIRSNGADALQLFEEQVLATLDVAAAAETARWQADAIRVERRLVGDRPASAGAVDRSLLDAALGAYRTLDRPVPVLRAGSTDSNVPLGLGLPAVTLNGGGRGDGEHSPDEWYQPVDAWLGPQQVLLTALSAVGIQGGVQPGLKRRSAPDSRIP